jgi:hypothetical protein
MLEPKKEEHRFVSQFDFMRVLFFLRVDRSELEVSRRPDRDIRTKVVRQEGFSVEVKPDLVVAIIVPSDDRRIVLRIEIESRFGYLSTLECQIVQPLWHLFCLEVQALVVSLIFLSLNLAVSPSVSWSSIRFAKSTDVKHARERRAFQTLVDTLIDLKVRDVSGQKLLSLLELQDLVVVVRGFRHFEHYSLEKCDSRFEITRRSRRT